MNTIMTRKRFLTALATLVAAPLVAAKAVAIAKERSTPKVGHIAVGMTHIRTGDWVALIDGHNVPVSHCVQALNDVEGWYDHYTDTPDGIENNGYAFILRRVHGNVSARYCGTDSRYAAFKANA